MKKTLALLLALAMVFSTVTVAFAEEAISAEAEACVTLGMLQGEGNGVDAAYLAKTPSRLTAAILFLRLKGLEEDALAYTGTENFADVDQVNWAGGKAILGYLKANPELGWIGDGAKFDPNKTLTAQQYYKVMLEALGYKQNTAEVIGDFTWEGVFEFAAEVGLSAVATVTDFTVNDVATATVEALLANVKGTEVSLAASLVEAGVLAEDAAIEAGVYAPIPANLAVDSVETDNLKTIVVKFNKEVKDTTITADTVKVYYGTSKQAVTTALADDNMTLYIYHSTGAFTQMKDHKVVINGVAAKDDAEDKVSGYENTLFISDTAAPVIENVVATSPKTLELYFSEPVDFGTTAKVYSSVKVDNVNTYVSNVDAAAGSEYWTVGKVVLTLGTALSVGDHVVKISNIDDFAGFPVAAEEFTLNIPADTTAPKIIEATMRTKSQIRVVFDEPVDSASVANTDFDVDGSANSVTSVSRINATTYDLNLGTPLSKAALVEIVIDYKGIKDHYGNQTSTYQTYTFSVEDDIVAPTLLGYAVTSTNKIELTFSEDVVNFDINDIDLYDEDNDVVVIPGGSSVYGKTIDGSVSNSVYVVELTNRAALSGAHTIKFDSNQDITDGSIRSNKFVGVDTAIVFNDLAAPTIASLIYVDETANDDVVDDSDAFDAQLTIYFSEAMDPETLANEGNFIFGNTLVSEMSGVTTTVADDNKSVTFVVDATAEYAFNGKNIYVLAVKDAAGTVLAVGDMNVAQTASPFVDNIAYNTVVSTVEATSKNTLKVTAVTGVLIKSIDPNKIAFVEADFTNALNDPNRISALRVMSVTIAADAKSAVLTLNNNLSEDMKFDGEDTDTVAEVVRMVTSDNGAIVINTDQNLAATPTGQTIVDKIVPTLASIAVKSATDDTIVVDFNEDITATLASVIYDITVTDLTDDNDELSTSEFNVAVVNGNLEIVITKTNFTNHKFSVSIDNGRFISDGNSNHPAAVSATVVENATGDGDAYFTRP